MLTFFLGRVTTYRHSGDDQIRRLGDWCGMATSGNGRGRALGDMVWRWSGDIFGRPLTYRTLNVDPTTAYDGS